MPTRPDRVLPLLLLTSIGLSQDEPVQPAAPVLPTANSPEASALVDKACDKMLAYGRGTFTTRVEQDNAVMRGRAFGMLGDESTALDGGWDGELRWGSTEDDEFAVYRGRTVAQTEDGWKLRGRTLTSGNEAPFLFDPRLWFQVLAALPADAKKVTHVEAGAVRGTDCAVLTISLTDDRAADFAGAGIVPGVSGGPMMRLGGMLGARPEKSYTVDLALYVDPTNGDVHRIRAKVYEDDPMLANIRIQMGPGGGDEDLDEPEEEAGPADDGPLKVKKGLPARKPGRTESVMYFRADFKKLGGTQPPALDETAKRWLEIK